MTQEDKELLLQDLCARLPYGVIGAVEHYDEVDGSPANLLGTLQGFDNNSKGIKFVYLPEYSDDAGAYNWFSYIRFKPYLRPMSSMTVEEKNEYYKTFRAEPYGSGIGFIYVESAESFDWLNKKMFDYRGLIPKDLAISTKVFNPYKN